MTRPLVSSTLVLLVASMTLAGCASPSDNPDGGATGSLVQVGSSTVFPIAEAWAEELGPRGIEVAVSGGGSGKGASAICAGEADIGDMSRPLKDSEIANCRANGIEPQVWSVAYDGLSVVISKNNDFIDHLSIEELNHIWRSTDTARKWSDVRAGWPEQTIVRFGPDSDSGTYEYFNEAILGDEPITDDFTPSADDNVLVEGVSREKYAIGHFGFAYYLNNADKVQAVAVQEGDGAAVTPSFETIADGSYSPLSRPIFMITNGKPAAGTALHSYLSYAMADGQALIRVVGYVELDTATLETQRGWL